MEGGFHLTPKYPPSNPSHLINFGTRIPNKVTFRRAAIAVFLVALLLFIYREMSRDVVTIDPFSAAKRFEESGLTPEVVANHIGDALQQIQTVTKTSLKKDVLSLLRDEGSILPQNRNVQRDPNGYVTLRRFDGVWWFVDGEGRRFFSLGVDCLGDCTGNAEPAMDPERRKKTVALVRAWGFNTAGAWSHPSFLPDLYFAPQIYAHLEHHRTDFFEPRTWELERKAAESEVRPFAGNKMLLGYFLENENGWDPARLLRYYLSLPSGAPGSRALVSFAQDFYRNDISRLNREWGTRFKDFGSLPKSRLPKALPYPMQERFLKAWLNHAAAAYYKGYTDAVRQADPGHLILGVRNSGPDKLSLDYAKAIGPYFDAFSVNDYDRYGALKPKYAELYQATGKPLLITEWSFSGFDRPGHRSLQFIDVYSQKNRAVGYRNFVTRAAQAPYMVGMHWFPWSDNSPQDEAKGGFLPDENMGLVSFDRKRIYEELVEECARVNSEVQKIHARARMSEAVKEPAVKGALTRFTPDLHKPLSQWPASLAFKPKLANSLLPNPRFDHTYYLAQDGRFLYMAGHFSDDHLDFPGKDWAWEGDSFAVYFSPQTPPDNRRRYVSDITLYPTGSGPKKDQPYAYQWTGPKPGREIKGAKVVRQDLPDGYALQARIPLAAIAGFPGKPGDLWNVYIATQNVSQIYSLHWDGLLAIAGE